MCGQYIILFLECCVYFFIDEFCNFFLTEYKIDGQRSQYCFASSGNARVKGWNDPTRVANNIGVSVRTVRGWWLRFK